MTELWWTGDISRGVPHLSLLLARTPCNPNKNKLLWKMDGCMAVSLNLKKKKSGNLQILPIHPLGIMNTCKNVIANWCIVVFCISASTLWPPSPRCICFSFWKRSGFVSSMQLWWSMMIMHCVFYYSTSVYWTVRRKEQKTCLFRHLDNLACMWMY